MCVCQCGQKCRCLDISEVLDPLEGRVAYGFHREMWVLRIEHVEG